MVARGWLRLRRWESDGSADGPAANPAATKASTDTSSTPSTRTAEGVAKGLMTQSGKRLHCGAPLRHAVWASDAAAEAVEAAHDEPLPLTCDFTHTMPCLHRA